MTRLTTTDLNEYRAIPARLRRLRDQRDYLKFINDVLGRERVEGEIRTLQKRRERLRRQGAH